MTEQTHRLEAALDGRYRIEQELGAGGMATVYLAGDLRHERRVALKVLKPELAAVVGAKRFLAEIKTTANLQHPHILPLYDSGEVDGFLFFVMPYVQGESLRARLDREHQLPVGDAVQIAKNMAEALDYAHRQGVIHRDIKPANVMLQDGKPVIADFGIALAVGVTGGGRLTETGLSLGTPHYMSPEQATGDLQVGPATDIYALGCVLYEMLVGEPPFTGSTPQAVLGKIITGEGTSVKTERASVPANVDAAIAKALEKVPADRFSGAQELATALSDPGFSHGQPSGVRRSARLSKALLVGWAAVMTIIAAGALWRASPAPDVTHLGPTRFQTMLPGVQAPVANVQLSPDGTHLAYVSGRGAARQLFVRPLDQLQAEAMRGTAGARDPFFSPDGQWVAYLADGTLRKIRVTGGDPQTIADAIHPSASGGSWGPDDQVLIGTMRSGLWEVAAVGGTPRMLTSPDADEGELGHSRPSHLPGGEVALLTVITGMTWDATRVEALSLVTGERRVVADSASAPRYASTGHVIFIRRGALFAIGFDTDRLEVTGEAMPVLESVRDFGFSAGGDLVYLREGSGARTDTLVWVNRQGEALAILPAEGQLAFPRLSPDGNRVALTTVGAAGRQIWTSELRRPGLSRFTFEGTSHLPVWTPDGERIVFSSDRSGASDLYWRLADGTGEVELVYSSSQHKDPGGWSPDGSLLAFAEVSPDTDWDIWVVPPDSASVARPLIRSSFAEHTPMISPDGAWLAYTSNESGRFEVNVIPFPDGGRTVQVSFGGGIEPLWSRNGRELFYRSGDSVMAVAVPPTGAAGFGHAELLFRGPFSGRAGFGFPNYDVAPGGNRFLMAKAGPPAEQSIRLDFVLNWFEELRERTGTN